MAMSNAPPIPDLLSPPLNAAPPSFSTAVSQVLQPNALAALEQYKQKDSSKGTSVAAVFELVFPAVVPSS